MDKKLFLIVIDTTEAKVLRNMGRGILNVHIILASDEVEARQSFFKLFRKDVSDQLQYNIYVYELDDVKQNLVKLDVDNILPVFSFIPLNGGRPAKQNVPVTNTPNQQQNMVSPQNHTTTKLQEAQNIINREKSQNSTVISKEKMDLLKSVGAIPLPKDADDRYNPRLNTATGVSQNISQNAIQQNEIPAKIDSNKMDLLKSVGVNLNEYNMNIDVVDENEKPILTPEEESRILNEAKVLSDEEIKQLEEQVKG